jgi:hypothetical protein
VNFRLATQEVFCENKTLAVSLFWAYFYICKGCYDFDTLWCAWRTAHFKISKQEKECLHVSYVIGRASGRDKKHKRPTGGQRTSCNDEKR